MTKTTCLNDKCKFFWRQTLSCAFKRVVINEQGKCSQYQLKQVYLSPEVRAANTREEFGNEG